jgi:acetyl-CoA synthetase
LYSEKFEIGLGNNNSSIRDSAKKDYISFWNECAHSLSWFESWSETLQWNPPFARWFVNGKINAAYNTLDIHQESKSDKIAILWEGEDGTDRKITYKKMFEQVNKLANVLKSLGVRKGDRVTIYLPMIPELPISMLACARIGAIHTVVFSGFSAKSLSDRVEDSQSKVIITADGGYRKGKIINLKEIVDESASSIQFVKNVIVFQRTGQEIQVNKKDLMWSDVMTISSDVCKSEKLDSNDLLYILYTSGTTGKPKGVLHGIGGYLTHLYSTYKWAFDIKDNDVYFCTADIGWVTGHSYVVYGPMLHGATQVMYEGAPDYPDSSRMWNIIQKYGVTIFYTTPTALRMLMKFGDDIPNSYNLSTLRLLGTVGEPINPHVWKWYFDVIGKNRCPIIDTWWQTETGGMLISPLPGIETIPLKPGSATLPIPGLDIEIVDEFGNEVKPETKGSLIIKTPWPGMLLGLWKDNEKYKNVYWSKFESLYYTGDYAIKDSDGYLWLLGRSDDVLKVAGHRIGTAELESSIVSHIDVAESAVCGIPDEIKGESIIAFVVLKNKVKTSEDTIRSELRDTIRTQIGSIATPSQFYIVKKLPKTRSGKIMRRLLKAIAKNEAIGDVSTLEDGAAISEIQSVFNELQKNIQNQKQ